MNNGKLRKKRVFLKLFPRIARIQPFLFFAMYFSFFLNGALFSLIVKVKQVVFDGAVHLIQGEGSFKYMIAILLLLFFVEIIAGLFSHIGNFIGETYDLRASQSLFQDIHKKIAKLPNIYFEDNKVLDSIEKSYSGIGNAMQFMNSIMDLIFMYLPFFIFMGIYLFRLKPILIVMLLLIFIPVLYTQFIKAKIHGELENKVAPYNRKLKHYEECAVGRKPFKETRSLGAFFYFRNLIMDTLKTMQKLRWKAELKNNKYELSARLLSLFGYLGVLYLLFNSLMEGEITVGAFAAVFYSIDEMYGIMEEAIVSRIGSYAINFGKIQNYFSFMELEEEDRDFSHTVEGNISLRNVSFMYPNAELLAIDNISFDIKKGEKIAVVGENGSGKTTFVRLLTGLYLPTDGEINWDGFLAKNISFDKISQVFQNYQRYQMTLEENVWISESNKEMKEEYIENSLKESGLKFNSKTFPNGMKTILSKEFSGVDISGGQWQRIAIARAFFRDSNLVILDEPTSSIDPLEEEAIYGRFRRLLEDKTGIIITHRLGAVRFVDKVLLLNRGRVIGYDTHNNLLKNCIEYEKMWNAQACQYTS